jgi:hypothetical protein
MSPRSGFITDHDARLRSKVAWPILMRQPMVGSWNVFDAVILWATQIRPAGQSAGLQRRIVHESLPSENHRPHDRLVLVPPLWPTLSRDREYLPMGRQAVNAWTSSMRSCQGIHLGWVDCYLSRRELDMDQFCDEVSATVDVTLRSATHSQVA